MTATLHAFPASATGLRDRVYDLVRANTDLAMKVMKAERILQQTHEYAARRSDALLAQMMREALEELER